MEGVQPAHTQVPPKKLSGVALLPVGMEVASSVFAVLL